MAGSVFYYYLISLPQIEIQKLEFQRQEKEKDRVLLENCLNKAQVDFEQWVKSLLDYTKKEGGWFSPDELRKFLEQDREECFKKYPIE